MKTSQELEAELIALGDTAEAVANALEAMGIKGSRCRAGYCPLAIYLQNISGEEIVVGPEKACFVNVPFRPWINFPVACRDFVRKFDCNEDFFNLRIDNENDDAGNN
jgi:hypothetical protein